VPHIAGAHHEKLNGSGYPFGLKGDQISRGARILAIADVYDALVSYDRPYKRAMPPDEALAILEQGKGSQFDANLLDVFTGKKLYELERREFRRINAELAIEYAFMKKEDVGHNRPADTRTMNISAGGILFPARENIPDGTFLDAIVHLPEVHLGVICKVVHCKPNSDNTSYEIGVRFVNVAQAVKERLAEYLVTLPETQPS
jgi:hypothetical protein